MLDEITTITKDTLACKLGVDVTVLKGNVSFADDLGADSLDIIETFMEIEKQFNITINEEDAEKLKTVDSLVQYIKLQIK